MALRRARIYREFKRPYTRTAVKVHRKAYIKGVPGSKLHTFEMGNAAMKGKFEKKIYIISCENAQVRHNSLESGRISANSLLRKKLDDKNFFMKVLVYPHQVLREHAQAAIAQADRFYQGMAHAFGKPSGSAARIRKSHRIMVIEVNASGIETAKQAGKRVCDKMPMRCRVEIAK
ncbi:MAG: 50S ribosomal protein L16 [Nanoarchaeota archaeon]|nr:50S ribosomal protein L16 [Nanoarchaeota archaeon]MBU4451906.1 50S ribosomal protein L16 [Nanoarchaeota archaeon]MCG2724609.1 50S ribosomal protein L16 [archaeon]